MAAIRNWAECSNPVLTPKAILSRGRSVAQRCITSLAQHKEDATKGTGLYSCGRDVFICAYKHCSGCHYTYIIVLKTIFTNKQGTLINTAIYQTKVVSVDFVPPFSMDRTICNGNSGSVDPSCSIKSWESGIATGNFSQFYINFFEEISNFQFRISTSLLLLGYRYFHSRNPARPLIGICIKLSLAQHIMKMERCSAPFCDSTPSLLLYAKPGRPTEPARKMSSDDRSKSCQAGKACLICWIMLALSSIFVNRG